MNEKKKGLIILGVAALFVLLIVAMSINSSNQTKEVYKESEITLKQFDQELKSTSNRLIYLGRPTCSYCKLLNPILDDLKTRYNFTDFYLNTDALSSTQLSQTLSKLGVVGSEFGTPYLAIYKNNIKVDEQKGFTDEKGLFDFLQKNQIIASDAKLLMNYVDFTGFKTVFNGSKAEVVVLGQTTCSYCLAARPSLNELVTDYKIDINYLNITNMTTTERTELDTTLASTVGTSWGTPLMLIVKDGKVVKFTSGFVDKATYVTFLTTNGIIK